MIAVGRSENEIAEDDKEIGRQAAAVRPFSKEEEKGLIRGSISRDQEEVYRSKEGRV